MERCFLSCLSWAGGRAAARMPAPTSLWSRQDQVQNTQVLKVPITNVGSLFCTRLRNLVIWELWVCLLAGLSYETGLEMFTIALIPAVLTCCPFSAGCSWKRGSTSSSKQHRLRLTPDELSWLTGWPASVTSPGQLCQTPGQGQAWCSACSAAAAARERLAQPSHRWLERLRAEARGSPPSFAPSFF